MANYTEDELKGMSIHTLRVVLRSDFGGVPGIHNKNGLIAEILRIQSGEVKPVRSPKGRKPLDEIPLLFNPEIAFAEDLEREDGGTVKGVFELSSEGYGFLKDLNLQSSSKDIFVTKTIVSRFGLRMGDTVEGEYQVIKETGAPFLKTVSFVGGRDSQDSKQRRSFADLKQIYPDEKIKTAHDSGAKALRAVDLFCPIGKGQRCLVVDEGGRCGRELLKQIAIGVELNQPLLDVFVLLVNSTPEYTNEIAEQVGTVTSVGTEESVEDTVRKIKLFFERAKRRVEAGSDVVLLVDSLSVIAQIYDSYLQLSDQKSKQAEFDSGESFIKSQFTCVGNFGKGSSLTLIAGCDAQYDGKVISALSPIATGTVKISQGVGRRRREIDVDINGSFTVKDELLLSREEIELSDKLREDIASGNITLDELYEEI